MKSMTTLFGDFLTTGQEVNFKNFDEFLKSRGENYAYAYISRFLNKFGYNKNNDEQNQEKVKTIMDNLSKARRDKVIELVEEYKQTGLPLFRDNIIAWAKEKGKKYNKTILLEYCNSLGIKKKLYDIYKEAYYKEHPEHMV